MGIYQCFPAEDVGVEAEEVLRDVDAALQQDVALQCARIIDDQPLVGRQLFKNTLEVLAAGPVRRIQHVVPRRFALAAAPPTLLK